MDRELQLKLQAYADGELSPAEAREVQELLARDAEARAGAEWFSGLRAVMRDAELERKLPESREFYWSKIEREIRRAPVKERVGQGALSGFLAGVRRFFNPVGAAALVALVLAFAMFNRGSNWSGPEVESTTDDAGALTYIDYRTGTTLVWLSYPASSDYE